MLYDEDEMTAQCAQQAVVFQGEKADETCEFADPLLRVDKVYRFGIQSKNLYKSTDCQDLPID